MKRHWDEHELAERWSLTHDEFELVRNRTDHSRIGFAALLKFFQVKGRFPNDNREVPTVALEYLANQLVDWLVKNGAEMNPAAYNGFTPLRHFRRMRATDGGW